MRRRSCTPVTQHFGPGTSSSHLPSPFPYPFHPPTPSPPGFPLDPALRAQPPFLTPPADLLSPGMFTGINLPIFHSILTLLHRRKSMGYRSPSTMEVSSIVKYAMCAKWTDDPRGASEHTHPDKHRLPPHQCWIRNNSHPFPRPRRLVQGR